MTIVNSFLNMQVGDKIPCRYKALSGAVGQFSELGTCTASEIPFASSATPDGLFYFIMAGYDFMGRKKLISDRNIQHSISWDTLNSAGIASGVPVYIDNLIPVMTGNTVGQFTVSASSGTPYYAFDKSTATRWSSGAENPASLQVDSTTSLAIGGYRIGVHNDGGGRGEPKTWIFKGSNNGTEWTNLDTVTNYAFPTVATGETSYYSKTFSSPVLYRYYKIDITDKTMVNSGSNYVCINEMHLFAKADCDFTLRLPTGGASSTDKDNEWDKIIAESTLNGTITVGDNNVWHWSGNIQSWTSAVNTSNAATRAVRGYNSVSDLNGSASSNTQAATAFRPVLLVESLIPPTVTKMLFLEGTDVVKFTGTTKSIVGTAPATPEMFETDGMDTLTDLAKADIEGMKLMYYTTDLAVTPKKITYKAAVQDKLLVMNKDISLENIENIDFWRFTSTLSGNSLVKIIASNNGGTSWKTWNAGWQDIEATAEAVKAYGMTVPVFNALTSEWNDFLLNNDKVRFAILMSLDSPSDIVAINRIEALEVQFDGSQRWVPATPDTEYTTERQTSTTVRVDLFISGDVKIYYPK